MYVWAYMCVCQSVCACVCVCVCVCVCACMCVCVCVCMHKHIHTCRCLCNGCKILFTCTKCSVCDVDIHSSYCHSLCVQLAICHGLLADMNECETKKMCPNGQCFNMDGSYKCVCNPGYRQSPNQQICYGKSHTSKLPRLAQFLDL